MMRRAKQEDDNHNDDAHHGEDPQESCKQQQPFRKRPRQSSPSPVSLQPTGASPTKDTARTTYHPNEDEVDESSPQKRRRPVSPPRLLVSHRTSSSSPAEVLQPGVVLFKGYLSIPEQITVGRAHIPPELVNITSEISSKARTASTDLSTTPRTPTDKSRRPPSPFECVLNYYAPFDDTRLSFHDERSDTGVVISLSVGDTAVFAFKPSWRTPDADIQRVSLESGDVMVFGGVARGIVHGVEKIVVGSAPKAVEEVMMGRINFNVRER